MKNLIMICALVLGSQVAKAGLLLEPYAGYQFGEIEVSVPGASVTNKDKGLAIGGRIGYEFMLPWVALDVKYYTGKNDATPEAKIKATDIGVTGGVSLPVVRPYAGYILKAEAKADDGSGEDKLEGNGYKLGLGLTPLPFIDFNIEYSVFEFKKINGNDIASGSSVKGNSILLAVGMTF